MKLEKVCSKIKVILETQGCISLQSLRVEGYFDESVAERLVSVVSPQAPFESQCPKVRSGHIEIHIYEISLV